MFDLKSALKVWRRDLRAAGLKENALLGELECHLIDAMEELVAGGMTAEEAFLSASRSIGTVQVLGAEFGKIEWVHDERKRREAKICFLTLLALFTLGMSVAMLVAPEISDGQRASGMMAIMSLPGLVFAGRALFAAMPVRRFKTAILSGAGMLALAWSCHEAWLLRADEILFGESMAVLLWAVCPAWGLMAGVHWGIQAAVQKHAGNAANPVLH
ncbi:permease prefix domain 1-containing protein [Luteolibacter soli]|uniref:Permease prefix domain 1-containing protein n=1 Tax=Luteolibacter soli TaxID=3135280 RepID=A0ABU9AVM8_9BACT